MTFITIYTRSWFVFTWNECHELYGDGKKMSKTYKLYLNHTNHL